MNAKEIYDSVNNAAQTVIETAQFVYEIYKTHNGLVEKVKEFKEIEKAIKYCREHNPNNIDDELYFSNQETWHYIRPKGEK